MRNPRGACCRPRGLFFFLAALQLWSLAPCSSTKYPLAGVDESTTLRDVVGVEESSAVFEVDFPTTLLNGLSNTATLTLRPVVEFQAWPQQVVATVTATRPDGTDSDTVVVLPPTQFAVYGDANSTVYDPFAVPTILLTNLRVNQSGSWTLNFSLSCVDDRFSEPRFVVAHRPFGNSSSNLPTFCNAGSTVFSVATATFVIPGVLSLLPPILTLVCAIATKLTLVSLLLGIWTGALCLNAYNPLTAFLHHNAIILFTFLLGGLLGVVQKGGGFDGLANLAQSLTKGSRTRGLVIGFALGCIVFFDDYVVVLVVGSALKPILAQIRVAPEKAAFMVHCLGVCVAGLAPVSSWLGAEIGYIQVQVAGTGMDTGPDALDPFEVFLQSITYRLFPILLLVYILTLIVLDREWGPLYGVEVAFIAKMDQQAEARERRSHSRRQRSTSSVTTSSRQLSTDSTDVEHGVKHAAENVNNGGLIPANAHSGVDGLQGSTVDSCVNEDGDDVEDAAVGANPAVEPEKNVPKRAVNAILPFGIVIVLTFVGMYMNGADTLLESGRNVTFSDAIANSSSIIALIWAVTAGIVIAIIALGVQRIANVQVLLTAWNFGATEVLEPGLILLLAWGLGDVISDLHTAKYIASALEGGASGPGFPVSMVQPVALLLSMVVAFATGSAMGTMGILFPLCIPLAVTLSADAEEARMMVACVSGGIFSGCAFGNCCSPIADCSVLASLAVGCDMADHVRTAIPHCALVGAVSLALAFVPLSVVPLWGRWVAGIALLGLFIAFFTRRPLVAAAGMANSTTAHHAGAPPLWWQRGCCAPKRANHRNAVDSQLLDPLVSVDED